MVRRRRTRDAQTLLAFAAVYVVWGSTYLAIRFAVDSLPPFLMAGARFLVAGALLYAWARVRGAARPTAAHWRAAAVVGALLFVGGNGGVTWAEQWVPSGVAALLIATEPLWIVVLGWLRGGRRPSARLAAGLLVGFGGVWLLLGGLGDTQALNGTATLLGAGVVVGAGFTWALGSLYAVTAPAPDSPFLSSALQMLLGGSLLVLTGTVSGEWQRLDVSRVTPASIGAFLYLIIFGSIIAFTAYTWLLRAVSPAHAATYAYVNPVVAVLLGWAVAGEPLGARTLLATAVIVASVTLIVSRHGEQTSTPATSQAPVEQRTVAAAAERPAVGRNL